MRPPLSNDVVVYDSLGGEGTRERINYQNNKHRKSNQGCTTPNGRGQPGNFHWQTISINASFRWNEENEADPNLSQIEFLMTSSPVMRSLTTHLEDREPEDESTNIKNGAEVTKDHGQGRGKVVLQAR